MQNTDPLYITRFVAAMAIVVHHFVPPRYKVMEGWENLIHNFNEGVNYFYFLSGFVMILAYRKYIFGEGKGIPKVSYWIKRFARIYPVYLLALVIILSFHFWVEPSFTSVWQRLPFELALIQQWIGFGSLNSPAWSVSCEAFFYLAFPFFVMNLAPLKGKKLLRAGLFWTFMILVITMLGFFAVRYNQDHPSSYSGIIHGVLNYHPFLRISAFVTGCLGGIWFVRNGAWMNKMRPYSLYFLLGSFFGVMLIMYAVPVKLAIWLNYGLLCPLYFVFVVSICNLSNSLSKLLSSPLCVFLGDISYGIYILQVPVQMYFVKFVIPTNQPSGFLLYCLVLILVSSVSYWLIEKPLRKEITDFLIPKFARKQVLSVSSVK